MILLHRIALDVFDLLLVVLFLELVVWCFEKVYQKLK